MSILIFLFLIASNIETFSDKLPLTAPKGIAGDQGDLGDLGKSGKYGGKGEKSNIKGPQGHRGNRGAPGISLKGEKGDIGATGPMGNIILPRGLNINSNKVKSSKPKLCIGSVCITEKDLKSISNTARYVKISSRNPYLQLSEVEVYTPENNINIALNKKTSQSSTGWGGYSNKAVDGNRSGHYLHRSTSHTNNHNSWWQVDLGREYSIGKLVIYTRTDCCMNRINDSNIQLINSDGNVSQQINYGSAQYRKEFIITDTNNISCGKQSTQISKINSDIPGCGLSHCNSRYNVQSVDDCETKCVNHKLCKAYSWAPKGGDKNHKSKTVCTLYRKTYPVRQWGPNQVLCKPKCAKIEHGVDYPGSDLRKVKNISSVEGCQTLCSKDSKCKSFTYGIPQGKWYDRICFLKKTYGHSRTKNNCCKSGRTC